MLFGDNIAVRDFDGVELRDSTVQGDGKVLEVG